jgi:soluble P-type ATPase
MRSKPSRNSRSGVRLELPGGMTRILTTLVLDFNGTLARDGALIRGVRWRLRKLARRLEVTVLTADTFGSARSSLRGLPLAVEIIGNGLEKQQFVTRAGRGRIIAIGNGRNDLAMMKVVGLGIAVLGPEGMAGALAAVAHVVTRDINDALDLLLEPKRLTATLRS